jgi:glucosamine-6-phosphate deaminase
MRVIIQSDYDTTCEWVAAYIKRRINAKRGCRFVLGLPTGSTPLGIYERLVAYHKAGDLSFANVITFNMDEYVGLGRSHPQSYSHFMHSNFFSKIDISPTNIHLLDGEASDPAKECYDYERAIGAAGGIDLFLCGVGQDGHLAFNEPGSSLTSRTRMKTLCEDTISANSRFFEHKGEVPRQAMTVGIQTILEAREVVVVATGRNKARALKECVEGSVSSTFTCTSVQTHPNAIVAADEHATDDLMVKTVKYYKSLQNSIGMMGSPLPDHVTRLIKPGDQVLITSPHPDDDVIGMGGTMQMLPNQANVKIAYMTNGDGGIAHPGHVGSRMKEAESALSVLGFDKSNILETNLPFYRRNDREVGPSDTELFEQLLSRERPAHLFVCADQDPNGTHMKCYDIIKASVKNPELRCIWLYTGAWGDVASLGLRDPFVDVHVPEHTFMTKLVSIRLHLSQNPPVVSGGDERDFVQRAIDQNKVKDEPGRYVEWFKVLDAQDEMPSLSGSGLSGSRRNP